MKTTKSVEHCPRLFGMLLLAVLSGCSHLDTSTPGDSTRPEDVRVSVCNKELHRVSDLLFGQFMERPSWGGETGPEAALLPGTHTVDPRVESLLRTMAIPIVRFPGGTDVDFTDWRNMVTDALGKDRGRPDSRGSRGNSVTNAFGYDEYFRLASDLKWKSILVVNLHDGLLTDKTAAEAATNAAALLAYCVGTEATVPTEFHQWPALRVANGHPTAYDVEYVQIGNESWFWQGEMKKKHGDAWVTAWANAIQAYMAALRRIQPGIKIIADGHPLEVSAELHRRHAGVDLFAQHRYYPLGIDGLFAADGKKLPEAGVTPGQVWETLTHSTPTDADGLAEFRDDSIEQATRLGYRLAITEWNLNTWWRLARGQELSPGPGACGLGAAVMVQALLRRSDTIALATQSMLLGQSWGIAGIRVHPQEGVAPTLQPTAEAVTLYNQHHGDRELRVRYDSAPLLWHPAVKFNSNYRPHDWPCMQAMVVDVVATRDRDHIYLHAINTDFDKPRRLSVRFDGFAGLPGKATLHRLRFHTATEYATTNTWTTCEEVQIHSDEEARAIDLPPRSLTIVVIDLPAK